MSIDYFTLADAPDGAHALAECISDISELTWCAGWLDGVEYAAWGWLRSGTTEPVEYGMGLVTPDEIAELRALSARCNGWVMWREIEGDDPADTYIRTGPYYVPMAEWLEIYEGHLELQKKLAAEAERLRLARIQ